MLIIIDIFIVFIIIIVVVVIVDVCKCCRCQQQIWRSYWAQRMLWDIDARLVFAGPTVYQDRNEHDYLQDFIEEGWIVVDCCCC
jgi:hypothetical protein